MERFSLFGASHLIALAVTALCAWATVALVRRDEAQERRVRFGVGALVLGSGLGYVLVEWLSGTSWRFSAPLHLCDLAVFVGALALFARSQWAFELLYFWGLTGTLIAMLMPDLAEQFPHHRFLFYFAQHGSLVVAAVFLAVGLRMRPRPFGVVRAWVALHIVAVFVGLIDWIWDVNFLYLSHKPGGGSPMDWMGEWPWYLVACDGMALALFAILNLPFWWQRRRSVSAG